MLLAGDLFTGNNDTAKPGIIVFLTLLIDDLLLLLLCIAYSIVISILSGILLAISWRLSFLVSIITTVGSLGITVLAILGIIHAAKGETKPLPLIGGIKLLK